MLDEALPPGLDVLEVVESPGGSLADLLEASRWRIGLTADHAAVADAVARFLAADEVLVERMTKKGMREFDARGAVLSLVVDAADEAAPGRTSIDVVLRHGDPGRASRRRPARADGRGRPADGRGAADDAAGPGPLLGIGPGRRPAGGSGIAPLRSRCAILATFDALTAVGIRRADDVLAGRTSGRHPGWVDVTGPRRGHTSR